MRQTALKLLVAEDQPPWMLDGNCIGTDPDMFFPTRGESTNDAKQCCVGCRVRTECLDYAMVNKLGFGVWGGLSERERKRLRRQRRKAR